jgi:hypothetical protein
MSCPSTVQISFQQSNTKFQILKLIKVTGALSVQNRISDRSHSIPCFYVQDMLSQMEYMNF